MTVPMINLEEAHRNGYFCDVYWQETAKIQEKNMVIWVKNKKTARIAQNHKNEIKLNHHEEI